MLINNDTIIKDNNPIIREHSLPVPLPLSDEDAELLKQMYQYVKDSTDPEIAEKENLRPAVGISAIQLGVKKQLTAIIIKDIDKNGEEKTTEYCLVNPHIVSNSVQKAYLENGEGCLSVGEEHQGHIVRSARITVEAYDALQQKNIRIRARGYEAIVLQHELDHFKGILFYDHIDKSDPFKEVPNALVV